jgi:hypothetical protein
MSSSRNSSQDDLKKVAVPAWNDSPWTSDPAVNDYLATMELPPEPVMQQYIAERAPLEAAAPKVGEVVPDFRAERLGPDGLRSGELTGPADFRGRPLALLFGNYTCPIYRGQFERFAAMYEKHRERVEFLVVYVKEAHPEDGWQIGINHDQCVVYQQPTSMDERAVIAADFIARHQVTIPVAIDDMENTACDRYAGSPERLYIIDEQGVVMHRSPEGPFQMDAVDAWCDALSALTD